MQGEGEDRGGVALDGSYKFVVGGLRLFFGVVQFLWGTKKE